MTSATKRAVVLGGGVAGIAASFELCDRGYQVQLLEASGRLGGRVFSFDDARLEDEVDNGPHVMLGCYDHMRRLLRRLGTEGDFVQPASLSLAYREPGGSRSSLELSRLPVPFAMPGALRRAGRLSWRERVRAMRGMVAALRGAPASWTLEEWLRRRNQQGGPERFLWGPMCRAIMNAEPSAISADLFLRTLRRAFSGSAGRAAMWIPTKPWSAIVGRPAHDALQRAGVRVELQCRVRDLRVENGQVTALALERGEERAVVSDELVVSAVPWHRFARWSVDGAAGAPGRFEGRAIVNLYFDWGSWPGLGDDASLTALVDGSPFQFVYRRPGDRPGRFALIAAACDELEGRKASEVERLGRSQLGRYYPGLALPDGGRARVTVEPLATLVVAPGVPAIRPEHGRIDAVDNLVLCGDWTQTHLPSTLEGAAASGFGVRT